MKIDLPKKAYYLSPSVLVNITSRLFLDESTHTKHAGMLVFNETFLVSRRVYHNSAQQEAAAKASRTREFTLNGGNGK